MFFKDSYFYKRIGKKKEHNPYRRIAICSANITQTEGERENKIDANDCIEAYCSLKNRWDTACFVEIDANWGWLPIFSATTEYFAVKETRHQHKFTSEIEMPGRKCLTDVHPLRKSLPSLDSASSDDDDAQLALDLARALCKLGRKNRDNRCDNIFNECELAAASVGAKQVPSCLANVVLCSRAVAGKAEIGLEKGFEQVPLVSAWTPLQYVDDDDFQAALTLRPAQLDATWALNNLCQSAKVPPTNRRHVVERKVEDVLDVALFVAHIAIASSRATAAQLARVRADLERFDVASGPLFEASEDSGIERFTVLVLATACSRLQCIHLLDWARPRAPLILTSTGDDSCLAAAPHLWPHNESITMGWLSLLPFDVDVDMCSTLQKLRIADEGEKADFIAVLPRRDSFDLTTSDCVDVDGEVLFIHET